MDVSDVPPSEGASSWDLVRGLDLLAGLLIVGVVVMAFGGLLAGVWPTVGVGNGDPGTLPVSYRLEAGLNWASPFTSLLLLGALGLFGLPRVAWQVPATPEADNRLGRLLLATSIVAGITSASAVANLVSGLWDIDHEGLYLAGPRTANTLVAAALAAVACGVSVLADGAELFGLDEWDETEVLVQDSP